MTPLAREPETTVQLGGRITPEHRRMLEALFEASESRRPTVREILEDAITLTAAVRGKLAREVEGEGSVSIATRVTPHHRLLVDRIYDRLDTPRPTMREALEVIIETAYRARFDDPKEPPMH